MRVCRVAESLGSRGAKTWRPRRGRGSQKTYEATNLSEWNWWSEILMQHMQTMATAQCCSSSNDCGLTWSLAEHHSIRWEKLCQCKGILQQAV